MTDDSWQAATFEGAARAQADVIAGLTVDERVSLLEELLELALSSGALQRARATEQREIDDAWRAESSEGAPSGR